MAKKENLLIIREYAEYLNEAFCRSRWTAYGKKMRGYSLSDFFENFYRQNGSKISNILRKLLGNNNRFYVSITSISSKLTDEEINVFVNFIKERGDK